MIVKYKIIPIQDETWKETLLMYQKVKIINKKYAECNVSPHDGNDVLILPVYQQSSKKNSLPSTKLYNICLSLKISRYLFD